MNRLLVACAMFVMFIMLTIISTPALATDGEIEAQKLKNPFSFTGTLKFDLYVPKDKPAFTEQGVSFYLHRKLSKDWGLGAGVDQWGGTDRQQSNHWAVRPFATVNWKQFYVIGGYSTDTRRTGDNHIFMGMWYVDKIGKFDIFLDPRFYQSTDSRISSFVDLYAEIKYSLTDIYKIVLAGEYIGWTGKKDRNHHWAFAGIGAERKFKYFSLGLRPGIAWDMTPKGTAPTFWLRTYVSF